MSVPKEALDISIDIHFRHFIHAEPASVANLVHIFGTGLHLRNPIAEVLVLLEELNDLEISLERKPNPRLFAELAQGALLAQLA